MLTLLAYLHILIGLGLVLFVLLQDPKGGAMGVFSGGSSANSFFGASGASNFLTTTTKWLAIMFAASCLGLTYMTAKRGNSVMDTYTPPPGGAAPAVPGTPTNDLDGKPAVAPETPAKPVAPTDAPKK